MIEKHKDEKEESLQGPYSEANRTYIRICICCMQSVCIIYNRSSKDKCLRCTTPIRIGMYRYSLYLQYLSYTWSYCIIYIIKLYSIILYQYN